MNGQRERLLKQLQSTRDYLFDLYDKTDRAEIKLTLRLVGREIKRLKSVRTQERRSLNLGKPWTKREDDYLRNACSRSTQTKAEAKRALKDSAEHLLRTDAETFSRIRALGLAENLRAWANKDSLATVRVEFDRRKRWANRAVTGAASVGAARHSPTSPASFPMLKVAR